MQITDEQINKYQMLFSKHFGKEINKKDALDQGSKFVYLIETILKEKQKLLKLKKII